MNTPTPAIPDGRSTNDRSSVSRGVSLSGISTKVKFVGLGCGSLMNQSRTENRNSIFLTLTTQTFRPYQTSPSHNSPVKFKSDNIRGKHTAELPWQHLNLPSRRVLECTSWMPYGRLLPR